MFKASRSRSDGGFWGLSVWVPARCAFDTTAFTVYYGFLWAPIRRKRGIGPVFGVATCIGGKVLGSCILRSGLDLRDQSGLIWDLSSISPLPGVEGCIWGPLNRRLGWTGTLAGWRHLLGVLGMMNCSSQKSEQPSCPQM